MGTVKNKVAVVTGASRGAGRAIAAVLGEAGATVYVTGRTVRGSAAVDGLPGTIEDAAAEVTSRGVLGVPVMIESTKLTSPEGPRHPHPSPLPEGEGERGALIVSTVAWAFDEYLRNLYYDVSKAAVIRMVRGMAHDLRPHGVAAIAVAPGFMRTERVLAAHAAHPFDLSITESPEYLGRAVRALAEDANVMEKSGEVLTVGDLAREYGFTDVDGRRPAAFRFPAK